MGDAYPELNHCTTHIESTLLQEEQQFGKTLEQGFKLFRSSDCQFNKYTSFQVKQYLNLYDTYGFPGDLTADIARERGLSIDMIGFEHEMTKQRLNNLKPKANFIQIMQLIYSTKKKRYLLVMNIRTRCRNYWVI